MKIIAVIERPTIIRQILKHLDLPSGTSSLQAPTDQTSGLAGDHPSEWSYEPVLDHLPPPIRCSSGGA